MNVAVILVLLGSLFVPTQVRNQNDLLNHKLGLPLPFVTQDISNLSIGVEDSPPFPQRFSFLFPLENPTKVLFVNLFVNYLVLFLAGVSLTNWIVAKKGERLNARLSLKM